MTILREAWTAAGPEEAGVTRQASLVTLLTVVVLASVLHFGSEVFLPLSIATLIAFALAPVAEDLRRRGVPRIMAVLIAVTLAFLLLGGILFVMASQLALVAERLPMFQSNILAKLQAWQSDGDAPGVFGRLIDMAVRISDEIGRVMQPSSDGVGQMPAGRVPMQVAVVDDQTVWQMLKEVLLPVLSPIVTAGLVIVVVIFMLLERGDLRDRFIRLVGASDLNRTTEMLEDAGSRVATYLLIQLLVNVIYAVPIAVGLWFIGVPNPVLWGLLTLVLRFVPYIGSVVAAAMPLFVAFAVSPDWSMVLWTAALFIFVELVTSNIVEPYLYGSRTGLSPLAVIVAAILWPSIWGPMGLILSTPLTVCLVVFGRYLPQFAVFDILFGDQPALAPHAQLYQRLLAGDVVESVSRAEETMETEYVADFYRDVGIPALLLAQSDHDRGVLLPQKQERVAASGKLLVDALQPMVADELKEAQDNEDEVLVGRGARIAVGGGRGSFDDVSARMLGQALSAEGAQVKAVARADLMMMGAVDVDGRPPACLVLTFLDPRPTRASLLIIRRIKRAIPGMRVGVVIWKMPDALADTGGLDRGIHTPASVALQQAESIGADFAVTTMEEAIEKAVADEAPKPLADSPKRRPRGTSRPKVA